MFSQDLRPDEVLYFYDEPLIFLKDVENVRFICQKIDEDDEISQYIVCPISTDILSAVMNERISLRSVYVDNICWIVKCDPRMSVLNSNMMMTNNLPENILPEKGVPIYTPNLSVPDIASRHIPNPAFLSVQFFGETMRHGEMSFDLFKNLIDQIYSSLRQLFISTINHATGYRLTEASLGRMINIPIRQPKFASLSLEIEKPMIDKTRIKQKINIDENVVSQNMLEFGEKFIDDLDRIVNEANLTRSDAKLDVDDLRVLEVISEVVPHNQGDVDLLKITASSIDGTPHSISIDRATGQKIRLAHKRLGQRPKYVTGIVEAISRRSKTFIIKSTNGRETTCEFADIEDRVLTISKLKFGMNVRVHGEFLRRRYRDKITLSSIEDMESGSVIYRRSR